MAALKGVGMRRPLIAGNWKMQGTRDSVRELVEGILSQMSSYAHVEWSVFSPFPYLRVCQEQCRGSALKWGGQTLSEHTPGAFTGEVAGEMLVDVGCEYVIVGHSERRQYFGETNAMVAKKFHRAREVGLKPVLCVGETESERKEGKTLKIVAEQLEAVLTFGDNPRALQDIVIAYEPVWAIGTGLTPSPEDAETVHRAIREQLRQIDPGAAEKIRLLYGGSVKPDNAAGFFQQKNIDGALIGGASLKVNSFIEIGRCYNASY